MIKMPVALLKMMIIMRDATLWTCLHTPVAVVYGKNNRRKKNFKNIFCLVLWRWPHCFQMRDSESNSLFSSADSSRCSDRPVSATNQLSANQLSANQLSANQISANQLSANQLSANQLSAMSLQASVPDPQAPVTGSITRDERPQSSTQRHGMDFIHPRHRYV